MPYMGRGGFWLLPLLVITLLVSSCGPSRASPAPQAVPTPGASATRGSPWPAGSWLGSKPTQAAYPILVPSPPPAETAYPWPPTRTPVPTRDNRLSPTSLADLQPISTPAPPPIILGTAIAPPDEQERYISTTVVIAPVGTGSGEIGYEPPISCGDCCPGAVKATLFAVGFQGDIYIHDKANQRVVQFDAQGSVVESTPLEEQQLYPLFLAAGPAGEVCIYDEGYYHPSGKPGIACYAQEQWAPRYPKPAWIGSVYGLSISEDGTVWLHTEGDVPGGPYYECCGYSTVMVPVGKSGATYDESRQRELAVLGFTLPRGRVAYSSYSGGTVYLHDRQGARIYGYRGAEQLMDIDQQGNLWTIEQLNCDAAPGMCFLHRARQYTAGGIMVASFDITTWAPEYPSFLTAAGAVYRFTFNETSLQYRVVRWEIARR